MSNLISVNVQECTPATSICHNSIDRSNISYLVTTPNTISNYRHDLKDFNENLEISKNEIYDYFKLRQLEINTDYKETHNNRNIKKDTKLYQEAVISFGREQFENCDQSEILKSLENFSDNFEQKYGCKILMTSLHLDEGHKSKDGTIEHNYHAHVLIENYSFETHKTCLQKLDYRKLQTDLAKDFEHLGFERGKEYTALQQAENQLAKEEHRKAKMVKPVRLEHREYREMKGSQSELELENIQLKNTIKKIEQPQENHAQLKTDNAEKSLQILQLHEQLRLAKEQYDADRKKLKDSGEAKQADYQKLKIEYDQTKLELEKQNTKLEELELTLIKQQKLLVSNVWSDKRTFTSPQLEYAQQIENEFNKISLFSKDHHICVNGRTEILSSKKVKSEHQRLTKDKVLVIDEIECRGINLADALENTTQKLERLHEINSALVEETKDFKAVKAKLLVSEATNQNLNQKVKILESTSGLDSQQLQGKILSKDSRIQSLENGNKAFAANLEKQETENRELKKDKSLLFTENYHLKIENTELKTALERFLDTPIVKRITEVSGTLLERLKWVLEGVTKQFDNHETEKQELKEELELQKETNSNLSEEVESLKSTLDDNDIYYHNRRRNNEMEM